MFEKLLELLVLALDRYHIPNMLIGGQAVLLYGEPRLTKDIDSTLGRHSDQFQESLAQPFLSRLDQLKKIP